VQPRVVEGLRVRAARRRDGIGHVDLQERAVEVHRRGEFADGVHAEIARGAKSLQIADDDGLAVRGKRPVHAVAEHNGGDALCVGLRAAMP